jgi:hypothetical protein
MDPTLQTCIATDARLQLCELHYTAPPRYPRARGAVRQVRNCVMTHSPTRDGTSAAMTMFVAAALIAAIMNAHSIRWLSWS